MRDFLWFSGVSLHLLFVLLELLFIYKCDYCCSSVSFAETEYHTYFLHVAEFL